MLDFDPNIANQIATRRADVEDISPVKKAFTLRFTGANFRWMGIAREERAGWVTVYINRQSRALDWFPVSDPGRYFDGIEIGFRYVRGHIGKGKNPGMAASIAARQTLKPAEDHVLLLHCTKRAGFEELMRWYAGEKVLGVGAPPSPDEISGEGPYMPLLRNADKPDLDGGSLGAVTTREPINEAEGSQAGDLDEMLAGIETGHSDTVDDDTDTVVDEVGVGGGWIADPERRAAVEQHAVRMAKERYSNLGFLVEELGKPFDLLCTPTAKCEIGAPLVHVEVKGSLGPALVVHLTRNEVKDARGDGSWRSDLYIVSGISLSRDVSGAWVSSGGTAGWIEGWHPRDEDLTPTDFVYVVPQSHLITE